MKGIISRIGLGAVVVSLATMASCNQVTRTEIFDSRTTDQQIAAGMAAAQSVGDVLDLYGRDVSKGISTLDLVPGKENERADWGAEAAILMAAYDHLGEMRQRLASGTGVSPQEINSVTQHGIAQRALNREWVLLGNRHANPDAVLASLASPKPWTRQPLLERIRGGNLKGALENERLHLYNYAGLMSLLVQKAKEQALPRADYWELVAAQSAGVHAIVEADVVAARNGAALDPRRITSAWDMAHASRTLMGYRLPEAFSPVLFAMRNLSTEQAVQLQGSNFMDKDALARFRGFWNEVRKTQQTGWLDGMIDQNPEMLATVWWCFRAIPGTMFTGSGDYVLSAPLGVESDAQLLATMAEASQPREFVPAKPAPAAPRGASESSASAQR